MCVTSRVFVQVLCVEDEYTLDGQIYSLDYRTLEGDVSLPHNAFKTTDFTPNGKSALQRRTHTHAHTRTNHSHHSCGALLVLFSYAPSSS